MITRKDKNRDPETIRDAGVEEVRLDDPWNLEVEITKVVENGVAMGFDFNFKEKSETDKGLWNLDKEITKVIETEDEPTEVESGGRPSRLGRGAKVGRHSRVGPSNDPVERKLQGKLNAGKRNAAKSIKESTPPANDDDNEDEDDDLESRSSAFAKKRGPPVSSLQSTKKQK
ncbi:hypothetical protein LWI28_021620 [Acer negundo]|uniref:Uncharacterized protein n=1 Tax=Acer negundo TaxID=4023 RepID=A0AAD5IGP3_ACENE|nr:hypothetical protein LWI28_021620 [Acer negundo]